MGNKFNYNELEQFYNSFAATYNYYPQFPLGLWCEIVKEFGTFDVMGQGHTDESFFIKHKLGICNEETYRQKLNILPFDKLNPKQIENVKKLYNAYNRSVQYEYVHLKNNWVISYNPKTMNSFMIVDAKGNGKCYYADGYVNPVRNRQTFPEEGIYVGNNDFNMIKDAVLKRHFSCIQKTYAPKKIDNNNNLKKMFSTNSIKSKCTLEQQK